MPRVRLTLIGVLLCLGCNDPTIIGDDSPEEPDWIANTPEEAIQLLARSYRNRDILRFANLLANDPDNRAAFLFIPDSGGRQNEPWSHDEMLRVHQRMFEPNRTPDGQTPVQTELWLVSVSITLTRSENFAERADLYQSPQNPTGLDPSRWKAMEAIYDTDVLFDLAGSVDYQANGRAYFVVIEDLAKKPGAEDRFLLLQWHEVALAGKITKWSLVMSLYN